MPLGVAGRRRRPRLVARWGEIRRTLGFSWPKLLTLGAVSVVGAVAEAGLLSLIVLVASAMSAGRNTAISSVGPLPLANVHVGTLILVALGLAVVRTLLQLAAAWLPARIGTDVLARVRRDLFGSFSRSAWGIQAQEREGHLQEMMSSQASNAGRAVLNIATGFSAIWAFVALVVSAVVVNPAVAVIVLATGGSLFFLLQPLTRLTRRMAHRLAKANLELATGVSESVRMAEENYVFGVEGAERERVAKLILNIDRPYFRTQLLSRGVGALYQGAAMILLIAGLGALYVIGPSQLPSLGAVVLILVRSLSYGQVAQSVYQSFNEQLPSIAMIEQTLDTYRESPPPDGSEPLRSIETIAADHISFAYDAEAYILRDVSFAIRRGEVTGVVGPSGAGKSTLVQVLLQLRPPTLGQLLINGHPAPCFSRRDWFRQVAYVPQDCRLIAGTVLDNIRFYRPWITDDDAVQAARRAHIYDDIMSWREGFQTHVGQRADAVSGGQRQRLAIARALSGSPQTLILDEPTSALDNQSEALIRATIDSLRGGTTVFLVSHRLSMLTACDSVMVFVAGELQAFGPPEEVSGTNAFLSAAAGLSGPTVGATRSEPRDTRR